ncbi:MAG: FAD/NAD(P)-binding protein [Promethearchaeota archaeon]
MNNLYIPMVTTIKSIVSENAVNDIKTFELVFNNKEDEKRFDYIPGQFAEISVIGKGECPIGIASSPTEKGSIKFTVKRMGTVTTALHNLYEGEVVGVRGPLGNYWPVDGLMLGKNIVVIGGGFAFSTLRSLVEYILSDDHRDKYGNITVIYGNRNVGEILYKEDIKRWQKRDDIEVVLTIDRDEEGWDGKVGFVAPIVKEVAPSSENAMAVICGPPIMIKTTLPVLAELKFTDDMIFSSLEMRMKCGIGKCGRCNIGNKFVCVDGPIFSRAELAKLPNEY